MVHTAALGVNRTMNRKSCVYYSQLYVVQQYLSLFFYSSYIINAVLPAQLTVVENSRWGFVMEEEPNAVLVAGQARLIIHQLDPLPIAEEMLDEHDCDSGQAAKYNAAFSAANSRFQEAVKAEMAEFMTGKEQKMQPAPKVEGWKERVIKNPLLCDSVQVKCKMFPQLAPELLTDNFEQSEYDYVMIPCNHKLIGHQDACPTTPTGNPGICCGLDVQVNYKKCPTDTMSHAIQLAKDWRSSNKDDRVPAGPVWAKGRFLRNSAQYIQVSSVHAFCFGLTHLFTPDGEENVGNTLMRNSPAFVDENGRKSIRLHLSSAWHGQDHTVDLRGNESPKRKRRELLPLPEENMSGTNFLEYLEYDGELNNTYVTVTPIETEKTAPIITVPKDNPDIVLEYYDDIEKPNFNSEVLPLNPPPLNPIGGSLPPLDGGIQGRDFMNRFNNFWTDNDENDQVDATDKAEATQAPHQPSPTSLSTPKVTSTSTSTTTTPPTEGETTRRLTVTSKPTPLMPDIRRIEPPKYAELPGQPGKSRSKSRTRRGWYGFLTKLGFLGLSPRYTDDAVDGLKTIEDHKIEQLGKAIATNTEGLLKVRTLGTRIKSVRQDFCQSVLEIQENSIVERLEMKLDETLQNMVSHLEVCNSGVVPLSIPEANLIKLCQSVSDSPVCHSPSVRSLFSCKVEGLNFITDNIVTAFDVQLSVPIADTYTLKLISVLPLFSQNKRTIKIQPEQAKPDIQKSDQDQQSEDPMELLGKAILAVQEKARRGKRDVVMNQVHSIANRIYAAIESEPDKYTFGFQNEADCKRLGNKLLICDWLQAARLDNCWAGILNGNEKLALQTCKSSTKMTEKTCFVKTLQSGYAISTAQDLDINIVDTNSRQNSVLKETESNVCAKFCTMTLEKRRKSITCDGKRLETSILSDIDIIVKTIASTDVQVDLEHLRPVDYSDSSGLELIDNFINTRKLIAPSKMQHHLKIMNLITTTGLSIVLIVLMVYTARKLCRWPWWCRLRLTPFSEHISRAQYQIKAEADLDQRKYPMSTVYSVKPRSN